MFPGTVVAEQEPFFITWVGRRRMIAPVGMTILLCPQELQRETLDPRNRIVIPTGADPDFLVRAASGVYVCGFLQENRMTLINATDLDRKSGGA
jgi:hypothetical protein